MSAEKPTTESEIHILPDGRVYLFGAGSELLDVVATLNHRDELLQRRREACRPHASLHEIRANTDGTSGVVTGEMSP